MTERRTIQGDFPYTQDQMEELKAEGQNHAQFFKNKTFRDTGETVGHQTHWAIAFYYDGRVVEEMDERDEPIRYYYAFESPANIDTSSMRNQDKIDKVMLDKAEPVVEEEVGRTFEITESHTFDSDDPLTELFEFVQDYE